MASEIDRDALKQLINRRISEGEAAVQLLEALLAPRESDCGIGRISANESLPDRGASEAILEMQREELKQLLIARARLDDPDFGFCQRCLQPIPLERLMAVPETRLCASCKRG